MEKFTLQEVQVKSDLAGSLVIITLKSSALQKNTPSRSKYAKNTPKIQKKAYIRLKAYKYAYVNNTAICHVF